MADDDTFVVNSEREFMALDSDLYPAIIPSFSGVPVSTAEMQSEGLTPGPEWFPAVVLAATPRPEGFTTDEPDDEPDPLDALPDDRYHDGTYEWEKDGEEGVVPMSSDVSTCAVCGGGISRYQPQELDPSTTFWSHFTHPEDDHDAVPVEVESGSEVWVPLEKLGARKRDEKIAMLVDDGFCCQPQPSSAGGPLDARVEQGKVGEGRLGMLDHMLDKDIALSSVDIRDLRRLIADALAAGAGQLQDTTKTAPDLAEGDLP